MNINEESGWGTGAIKINPPTVKAIKTPTIETPVTETPGPSQPPIEESSLSGSLLQSAGESAVKTGLKSGWDKLWGSGVGGNYGNFSNSMGILGEQTGLWGGGLSQGTSTFSLNSGIGAGQVGGVGSTTPLGGAPAGGSVMAGLGMVPFMAMAAFVVPKILQGMFGDKPKITFSGLEPKYGYQDGHSNKLNQYMGPDQDRVLSETKPMTSAKGYHYHIDVKDTGQNREVGAELVRQFDAMFDELAAQGIPVNELLGRNKDFYFGGRVDKGMTPQQLAQDVLTHMAPDIEAYRSGEPLPDRKITIKPVGPRTDGMAGRDAYDAGVGRSNYSVTVGPNGAQPDSREITLSPKDPRADLVLAQTGAKKFDKHTTPPKNTSLTPGYTYKIDTSGIAGRDAFDMGLNENNTFYTVPEPDRNIPTADPGAGAQPGILNPIEEESTKVSPLNTRVPTFDWRKK